ncbi:MULTISPECIES: TerC family protein [unclassified Arcicella]|uniref:TerC family protein n=1 Tax=unclassified Arcicella TaxID=2644986 RepID=UPI00285A878A|nr:MULTISPECIES: TerC family protein [unclassified Arcicella]MDR6561946.1 putative tellurium resistance membrane protein TerC [Arcicella sp. BE51]MDR6811817.1 putative tellurium resistance membrane protein TerC [Arcicella sp. BE140]MDR6822847.1 putative tellurium resistance membrane protein TerC [Arcicella sp. BE139]
MTTEILISLITLIVLEIVLGIDNIIFISILSDKLPVDKRKKARLVGLSLALITRLILLAGISWIMKLDKTLFVVSGIDISGKDLILIVGGLFLLYKSNKEIFEKTEDEHEDKPFVYTSFSKIIGQIIILDLVFSIDSIITAVGLVEELWVMYAAVIVSISIMMMVAGTISAFISKHPSLKILALCFLMMIGITLIAEGLNFHIPKQYIYFSMAFSFLVNVIQIRKNAK